MQPTQELIDDLFWDKVDRARDQPLGQKLLDGFELFEQACQLARMGIRYEYPEADEAEVERLLREQLARLRELEEHGIYHPLPEDVSL